MKRSIELLKIFLFVSALTAFTPGSAQVKTNLSKDSTIGSAGQPKLIKTQGTNEYANVHCGLMDKAGNLWFGTTGDGVYRYDGKLFIQFTVKNGLSNNTVWSILEDKAGNIWFGTDDGACCYDGKTISAIPIAVTDNSNSHPNDTPSAMNAVWSMLQDKTGKLWFGTSDGVYCYNGKSFTRFPDNDSVINKEGLQLKMVDCMLEDKNGIIWFASGMPPGEEGLCRYDGKCITGFKPNGEGWIRAISEEKNGNLLLTTRHNGVCRYDGKDFTNITEDRAGNIWFGTRNTGLCRYDGKTFTSFSE